MSGIPGDRGWEFPTVVRNSWPKAKNDLGAKNQFVWLGIPDRGREFPTVVGNSRPWLGIPDCGREFPTSTSKHITSCG